MEPFLGQIQPVGFGFAPRGWSTCSGQLLAISSYSALFSLFGTTYGGDGRTSFGLPDLRGREMIGPGTGPGLTPIQWGQRSGNQYTYLSVSNMASHNHTGNVVGEGVAVSGSNPNNNMFAGTPIYAPAGATTNKQMNYESVRINNTGSGFDFSNQAPYLGIYIVVAMVGIYPSRS